MSQITTDAEVLYLASIPKPSARKILREKLKDERQAVRLAEKFGGEPNYGFGFRAEEIAAHLGIRL